MNECIMLVLIRMGYLATHSRFIMSTPSESFPLIKPPPRRKLLSCYSCHFHYRLPRIKEKAAIIANICNLLIFISVHAQVQGNYFMSSTFTIAVSFISVVVFAIAGNVADTCVGRFKVIQASVFLLTTSSLLNLLLLVVQHYLELTTTTKTAFSLIIEGLCCVYRRQLLLCMYPSIHCKPVAFDKSFWRTAQLCHILDNVGFYYCYQRHHIKLHSCLLH